MEDFIIKLRHYRILGLSGFEIPLTIITSVILVLLTMIFVKMTWKQAIWLSVVFLISIFLIGIVTHYIFDVHTQLNYWLGLSECPPNLNSLSGMFECV